MNKRIIIAIDSLKGCLSSAEANRAAAEGIREALATGEQQIATIDVVQMPVSDGGEGWLEAFGHACGGELVETIVKDPLMRDIKARYLRDGDMAVIEMAQASGLTLLSPEERNPMLATSYGTGQLIAHAAQSGCRRMIVGLGGSATSDCGQGMLEAITDVLGSVGQLRQVRFTIATDVANPLCGEQGAAHVFAPQKGATPQMVSELDDRARAFADRSAMLCGHDRRNAPGAGAAGGLGYAFMQYLDADCRSGIELLLEAARFDELLEGATMVITGEGRADRQTLMGKLPYGILQSARRRQVPVALVAGRIDNRQQLLEAGFAWVECINPVGLPLAMAMKPATARRNIASTARRLMEQDRQAAM